MSKYNFENDVSLSTSTGLILDKIARGAAVLEFGCAEGRMTRHMKETLDCRVYIVEYDEAAFEVAQAYAEDGICDDILNFAWVDRFSGVGFDAIIFADVLEHLNDPERVLSKAAALLKDDGQILISIPNITHNDILLKAYDERFDYTSTGILDDSHVHFWGLKNLSQLVSESGLHLKCVQATYCPTGYTEQQALEVSADNCLLNNLLNERIGGEVYQFVLTLCKGTIEETVYQLKNPFVQSHIYLDTGNDFSDDERIDFESELTCGGSYIAYYKLESAKGIRRVRFDPVELQGCILKRVAISQGDQKLQLHYGDALEMGCGILLTGTDPMLYADVISEVDPIVVEAEIVIPSEQYVRLVQDELGVTSAKLRDVEFEKQRLHELTQILTDANDELRWLSSDEASKNAKLHERIAVLDAELEELRRDLGAYIIWANNKEKYALELKHELEALRKDLDVYTSLANDREKYILELSREIEWHRSLFCFKLRAAAVGIIKKILRRLKRVIGKEGH